MVRKPRKRSKKKAKKTSSTKSKKKVLKKRPAKPRSTAPKRPKKKAVKKKTTQKSKKKRTVQAKKGLAKKKTARAVEKTTGVGAKKPVQPKAIPVSPLGNPIGVVTHYFSSLGVAVVRLQKGTLRTGETIRIKGHTSDFQQKVGSMEIEHRRIESAVSGQEFGMKVINHAREHDQVFKV